MGFKGYKARWNLEYRSFSSVVRELVRNYEVYREYIWWGEEVVEVSGCVNGVYYIYSKFFVVLVRIGLEIELDSY